MEWGGNVGKVCKWSEVARSERWERNEVAIWERREGVSREDGMKFKDKIVLYCSREAKYKQGFTVEIS